MYKNTDFKHAQCQARYKISDKVITMSIVLSDNKVILTKAFIQFLSCLPTLLSNFSLLIGFLSSVINSEM